MNTVKARIPFCNGVQNDVAGESAYDLNKTAACLNAPLRAFAPFLSLGATGIGEGACM